MVYQLHRSVIALNACWGSETISAFEAWAREADIMYDLFFLTGEDALSTRDAIDEIRAEAGLVSGTVCASSDALQEGDKRRERRSLCSSTINAFLHFFSA